MQLNFITQKSTKVCFTACSASAFSLSRAFDVTNNLPKPGQSQFEPSNCNNDYMIIEGGSSPDIVGNALANSLDRYCGEKLNPLLAGGGTSSVTVCSK